MKTPLSSALPFALLLAALALPAHAQTSFASTIELQAQGVAAPASAAQTSRWVQTTLFFGASSSDGSGVSEQEWENFLKKTITPRFPDGLTVLTGYGQGRNPGSDKVVGEQSRVLIVVHPDTRANTQAVEEIKAAYQKRFDQAGVFHTRSMVEVVF